MTKQQVITPVDEALALGELPHDRESLESLMIDSGINPTAGNIQRSIDAQVKRVEDKYAERERNATQRPKEYTQERDRGFALRDIISIRLINFINVLVSPAGLLFLYISELFAFVLGANFLMTLGSEETTLTAWQLGVNIMLGIATVTSFAAIDVRIASLEYESKKSEVKFKLSWALIRRWWVQRFSGNAELVQIDNPELQKAKRLKFYLIIVFVLFASVYRIQSVMMDYDDQPFVDAIGTIFTQITISQMVALLGFSSILYVLLNITHFTINVVYANYANAVGETKVSFFDRDALERQKREEIDNQIAILYRTKLQKLWMNKPELERDIILKAVKELDQTELSDNHSQNNDLSSSEKPSENSDNLISE